MPADNRETIQREFARQAQAFEDPARSFGRSDVLSWIIGNMPVELDDIVLEVAAGTGLVSRALSPLVAAVVAVDLTPEMLAEGKRGADAAGLRNIVFQEGDATTLPFLDDAFDLVVCRLAVHHYEDPVGPLREMVRVCRTTGTITVIDMVVAEPSTQTVLNDLERRRDPAHTRALTSEQLRKAIVDAGTRVTHTSRWDNVLDGDRWLEQTHTPPEEAAFIRAAWDCELAGGPRTGMRPRRTDTGIEFVHQWDLLVADPL